MYLYYELSYVECATGTLQEGTKSAGNHFENNNAKILLYGKCHEKVDLSKRIGYEYNIMKLVEYDENTRSLLDRAFWWKSYNEHVIK